MSLDVQCQIRRNCFEVRDYFEDLMNWEDEIKAKSRKSTASPQRQQSKKSFCATTSSTEEQGSSFYQQSVGTTQKVDSSNRTIPTPSSACGSASVKTSSSIQNKKFNEVEVRKKSAESSCLVRDTTSLPNYYKAWDKYDIDAELSKLDDEPVGHAKSFASASSSSAMRNTLASDLNTPDLQGKNKGREQQRVVEQSYGNKKNSRTQMQVQVKTNKHYFQQFQSEGTVDSPPSPISLAEVKKEQANERLRLGKFRDAVDLYTAALETLGNPNNSREKYSSPSSTAFRLRAVILTNRSQAYLKLNRLREVIRDCTDALTICPNYDKAFYRRGMAYSRQKQWEAALEDLEKAGASIFAEPSSLSEDSAADRRLRTELQFVQQALRKERDEFRAQNIKFLLDPTRGENESFTSPFRRLYAKECGDFAISVTKGEEDAKAEEGMDTRRNNISPKLTEAQEEFDTRIPQWPKQDNGKPMSGISSTPAVTTEKTKNVGTVSAGNCDEEKAEDTAYKHSSLPHNPVLASLNFFTFEKLWNSSSYHCHLQARLQLLKTIGASQLPQLFRESLDSVLLYSLLHTLCTFPPSSFPAAEDLSSPILSGFESVQTGKTEITDVFFRLDALLFLSFTKRFSCILAFLEKNELQPVHDFLQTVKNLKFKEESNKLLFIQQTVEKVLIAYQFH